MRKIVEIKLPPEDAVNPSRLQTVALQKAGVNTSDFRGLKILKKSIDARSSKPFYLFRIELYLNEELIPEPNLLSGFNLISTRPIVHIIGAGPAGYFAALELIEMGYKPVIFDRGKDVRERRRDLRAIQQFDNVNPDSNYCFGEGGAGTYSDGKLYTKSIKRGNAKKVLQLLVEHGAKPDILYDAHPHIGSNKLPQVVTAIRNTILSNGGEVHFQSKLTDFILKDNRIRGFIINDDTEFETNTIILATGHSARDIFRLLDNHKIELQSKPFALGVRVEHPQKLIDDIQYGMKVRSRYLPAAAYKLTCQVKEKGVFSFCMCPGGLVVPSATAPGEIVVNGMSMSRRDSKFANSGIVVSVDAEMLKDYQKFGVFAGLEFQKEVEQSVFNAGDGSQKAPAMRMTDFVNNKLSSDLNDSSYIPGLYPNHLTKLLPDQIATRLSKAFTIFGHKMKGYYTQEANVIGVESRTSSPIRIPRDKESFMHPEVQGLFPSGEGAGYAGGILSAAMDGQNVARAAVKYLEVKKLIK